MEINNLTFNTMDTQKTCASIEPCIVKNADAHNQRKVKLEGIREELTKENVYYLNVNADERYRFIKSEYERTVGQRMSPHAHPIIEIVVVGLYSKEQAERFKIRVEKEFCFEVLSWAIHKDEGHFDLKTREWFPNYHAHFIADRTIWHHNPITLPQKRHGKTVKDEEGNVIMETKDRYARLIQLKGDIYSRMQDIASEVTGLKRGIPSSKKRLRAIQYKYVQAQKELEGLMLKHSEIVATIDGLNQQRDDLEEKNFEIENRLRGAYEDLKSIGQTIIGAIDMNIDNLHKCGGAEMSLSLRQKKEELERWSIIDPEKSHTSIVELVSSFAATLTSVILALLAVFEAAMANMKKRLAELQKQIKRQSLLQSTKVAIGVLLDKPANEQMRQLVAENQALETKNNELQTELKADQQELMILRSQVSDKKELDNKYRTLVREKNDNANTKNELMAELIYKMQPQDIVRLEYLGFPILLGSNRWDTVKTRVYQKQATKESGTPKKGGPRI